MGYYVSPDSTNVTGASATVNSNMMDLTAKYVTTVSSVSNTRGNITAEVVDLNSFNQNSRGLRDKVGTGFSSLLKTGADSSPSVQSIASVPPPSASGNWDKYWTDYYKATTTGTDKVVACLSAFGLGMLDIFEGLTDGIQFVAAIIGGRNIKDVTKELKAYDVKQFVNTKTGANVDGSFALGQTVGKILMCAGIIFIVAGTLAVAGVPAIIAACACGVVGVLVGIGLAVDAGVEKLLPIVWSGIKTGVEFALLAIGLMKTACEIAKAVASGLTPKGFMQMIELKVKDLKNVALNQWRDFNIDKLKFFLEKVFKLPSAEKLGKGGIDAIEAVLKFTSKTIFKAIDVVVAFFASKEAGARSLWGWIVKSGFSFGEAFADGANDPVEFVYSPFVGLLSGNGWSGWKISDVLNTFISNLPKSIHWVLS